MRLVGPVALLSLVMAQPNLATGMMPFYRAEWGLAPLAITVIFAVYLFVLVPTLLAMGAASQPDRWRTLIAAGTACAIAGDIVMALSQSAAVVCVARALAGVAVGLATGALAGVVLQRAGERGRGVLATCTVGGSALGTIAAAVVAQYLPWPSSLVYLLHAIVIAGVAAPVLWSLSGNENRSHATSSAAGQPVPPHSATFPTSVGYLSGIGAWVSAGLVVALLPSYGAHVLHTDQLVVLAAPVVLYLVAAWIVQRVLPVGVVPLEPVMAQMITVIGVATAAAVAWVPSAALLGAGAVLAGIGQGMAYRIGLHIVSGASSAGAHARVASRYAAVAYLCAAIGTVALGALSSRFGMLSAVIAAAIFLLILAFVMAALGRAHDQHPAVADRDEAGVF